MFQPVDGNVNFPEQELAIGKFWKEHGIYEQSLAQRKGAPPFVFYEGPPTANGMPHPGHCLTRAIKDLFPRYRTMRGYRCERKAGWDTHGLPVEVEVCKELGIHSKEEIEAYGIEKFIQLCQQSVWRYMQEWRRLTERIGFWVDLDDAYVTYHQSYVESVWWSLKNLFDRGLLYQGHKIVWWWAQGGTALSAGEVGQGYRQVADPSVFVEFILLDEEGKKTDESLIVWTTTPWTLPSNQFAAVHPDLEYSFVCEDLGSVVSEQWIVATALVESLSIKLKRKLITAKTCRGKELVGRRYMPPFEGLVKRSSDAEWTILPATFVTTDSGTGIVHIAPAFGEDDYNVLQTLRTSRAGNAPLLINVVGPDGKFTDQGPEYCRGRWVKDCDKDIIRDLKQRGLLFHQEQYVHDYPFCWRAEEDPLIQYPRESWFVRTTQFKDAMLANNAQINWLPEHIKDGRFGNFLESNVDWALSRERYWGTPLPIWKCEETGKMEAVGNYDELLAKSGCTGGQVWAAAKATNPALPDDLQVHKPYIDAVTYDSPFAQGAKMRRVSEVIDCWYDSGAMPFAQWGFPHAKGSEERFKSQFPADFISEAIDQTRGWFYSLLSISTLMFSKEQGAGSTEKNAASSLPAPGSLLHAPFPHPYRNCIVLGLMLGEDGNKMSKSKRNYREPNEIFDKYGADALRWYFFANQPPWTSIRYNEQAIKDSIPEFLLRLWNVYSFFVIYANIDGFDPAEELRRARSEERNDDTRSSSLDPRAFANAKSYRPVRDRSELDRWILSELNRTAAAVVERMDAYDNFGACGHITEFVDALSNWYVRRSRDRFWAADKRAVEKLDAYWTLYECLVTTAKMVAPFVPFLAETLWQNLASVFRPVAGVSDPGPDKSKSKSDSGLAEAGYSLESVHLCDYPRGDANVIDNALSDQMSLVRLISSLGRNARTSAALKVRQPLSKVEVILAYTTHQAWLEQHADVIKEELNVKQLEFCDDPSQYVDHEVNPNFKLLGPKLGKLLPKVKSWLGKQSGTDLLANIRDNGSIDLEIDGQRLALTREEVEVRIRPKPGWTSANDRGVVVVLSTELTPELIEEGLARDLVRVIQDRRKELGCQFTDRIELGIVSEEAQISSMLTGFKDYIQQETLAVDLVLEESKEVLPFDGAEPFHTAVGGHPVDVFVKVAI